MRIAIPPTARGLAVAQADIAAKVPGLKGARAKNTPIKTGIAISAARIVTTMIMPKLARK